MKQGIFISIEGPDGSGKSTQISFIKEYLENKNFEVILTREPGGTLIGEKIRSIILDVNHKQMSNMTEALLYAASRAQHVEEVIKPALEQGKVVICDRFVDSSIAYQGYGRKLGESVEIINSYAIAGCMPVLTLLLKLDPQIGTSRINDCVKDRLEQEKLQFHQDVYEGYLEIERRYKGRVVGIDASRNIEDIRKDIQRQIDLVLEKCNNVI